MAEPEEAAKALWMDPGDVAEDVLRGDEEKEDDERMNVECWMMDVDGKTENWKGKEFKVWRLTVSGKVRG